MTNQPLSKDEIKAIVARVYSGEYQYERDRPWLEEVAGNPLPSWNELTPEQQQTIRQEQLRYGREMNELGQSITQGQ